MPPRNISTTSERVNITVQWRPVDCIHRNGNITGYILLYRVDNSGSNVSVNVSANSSDQSVALSELLAGTLYTFQVAAVNRVGTGPYSNPVTELTPGTILTSIK